MNIDHYPDALFSPATLGAVFAALLFAVGLGWMVASSGSLHSVRFRLWRLVYGKTAARDAMIAGFLEEQTDLMSFRFHSGLGLRIRTLEHALRLIRWMKDCEEDIAAIRRAGNFFDVSALDVVHKKLDDTWTRIGEWIATALPAIAICVGIAGIVQPDAIVKIRKTDHWVALSPTSAKRLLAGADVGVLTPAMCGTGDAEAIERTSLRSDDIEVLCGIFGAADVDEALGGIVVEQRYAFAFAVFAFGILLWLFGSLPLRRHWAGMLRERLARRLRRPQLQLAAIE